MSVVEAKRFSTRGPQTSVLSTMAGVRKVMEPWASLQSTNVVEVSSGQISCSDSRPSLWR